MKISVQEKVTGIFCKVLFFFMLRKQSRDKECLSHQMDGKAQVLRIVEQKMDRVSLSTLGSCFGSPGHPLLGLFIV